MFPRMEGIREFLFLLGLYTLTYIALGITNITFVALTTEMAGCEAVRPILLVIPLSLLAYAALTWNHAQESPYCCSKSILEWWWIGGSFVQLLWILISSIVLYVRYNECSKVHNSLASLALANAIIGTSLMPVVLWIFRRRLSCMDCLSNSNRGYERETSSV
eukprot:TRINITY_DN8159_c0_g1_i2.p1 TRINITY_DN8159_c0_g1~~TRINITY_DN8159_c0_g1_i2.p1  ORF type:complete len:162 (+),score=15.20 TRINITY_DN8159_c0_g1_i2:83-568(+)